MSNKNEEARAALRQAHVFHGSGEIDAALNAARHALELAPEYVDAWSYLGTTLITRRLAYDEGLKALEQAERLAPDDPGIVYGLGWCYEFIAYRLEKQAAKPYRDPLELYGLAAERLRRCIELDPEPGLKDDAADLLESIVARTE